MRIWNVSFSEHHVNLKFVYLQYAFFLFIKQKVLIL